MDRTQSVAQKVKPLSVCALMPLIIRTKQDGSLNPIFLSTVLTLKEELTTAQSRRQEAQNEITEVQQALQIAQSQLRDEEAKNALIMSG